MCDHTEIQSCLARQMACAIIEDIEERRDVQVYGIAYYTLEDELTETLVEAGIP